LIFEDTANTIATAMRKVNEKNSTHINIAKTAFEIALTQLAP